MKKRNKALLIALIILILVIIKSGAGIFIGLSEPSINTATRKYQKCQSALSYLCKYFDNNFSEYSVVKIDLFDSANKIMCSKENSGGGYDSICYVMNDERLIDAVELLRENDFITILKEYNYIDFSFWGSFGKSVGLIYSSDNAPNLSDINALKFDVKELKYRGWYYAKITYE